MIEVPAKTEAEQQDLFDRSHERFLDACDRVGIEDHFFRIADTTICLRFAGQRMVSLLVSALEHLRIEPIGTTDFTFCAWDTESTGVNMVRPSCRWDAFTNRGDIWGFNSRRIRSAFHWVENSVNLMNLDTGTGIYWLQSADNTPFWVNASPLRTLMHWCMESRNRQLMHAAAVGTDNGAVLITGRGGVGKSTTALASLRAGLSYIGDDYLVVGLDPEPTAFSLYSTAKLNADNIEKLPDFRPFITNEHALDEEKAIMFLHPHFADRLRADMPIRAILVPRVQDRIDTGFSPIDEMTVRRAASGTTMSQLPHAGRYTHEYLDRLCRSVPSLRVDLGRDLKQIPVAIAELLESGADKASSPRTRDKTMTEPDCPLVTVIIPTYNGERFLRDAIASVESQRYPALEIIVIDDGSTDGTPDLVETLDTELRYYRQPNAGPAAARNRGIQEASGDLIAFLDVDDLWPDGSLHTLVQALGSDPQLQVVHGYAQVMQLCESSGRFDYVGNPEEAYPYYIGAGLYRKSAFESVGLFDPELRFAEDTDWYSRAKDQNTRIERLNDVTLMVRRHGGNMTSGRTAAELTPIRMVKKALDRRRATVVPVGRNHESRPTRPDG